MVSMLNIIPEPNRVHYREGSFNLTDDTRILVSPTDSSLDLTLTTMLSESGMKNLTISKASAERVRKVNPFKAVVFEHVNRSCDLGALVKTLAQISIAPEGYIIDIDIDRIILLAKDEAGLFYACQTLFQIIETCGRKKIPAVRIEDAPEMKVRGAQIELSFLTPTVSAIETQLRLLARYKINTVLVSYFDKFKFEKHPLASHPDAFDKKQIRKLDELARSLHIDLIPILQSFGHIENVLKNPEYSHLREGADIQTQLCPLHPESFELFKEMAEEVMEVHSSPYFHVGADETYFLGYCPKCKKIVEKEGKLGLYLRYINRVCEFVAGKGKRPVLWDDILCKFPEKLNKLHKKAIISYWDYFPVDARNPFVYFRGEAYYSDKTFWKDKQWWGGDFTSYSNCRDISELPSERMKWYRSYFTDGDCFKYFHPFPFYKFYQDAGYTTLGCAAVRGGEYGYICSDYTRRINNILQMIQTVTKNNGTGVITTSWSEMGSPEELTIYPLVATAEFSWSASRLLPDDFDRKYCKQFFGHNDPRLMQALRTIGGKDLPLSYNHSQRDDLCEKGGFNPAADYFKEIFSRAVIGMVKSPDFPGISMELKQRQEDLNTALTVLLESKPFIQKNKRLGYNHLILAARTLLHKIDQFFVVCSVEKLLQSGKPLSKIQKQSMMSRCVKLLADIRRLRVDNDVLFLKTYHRVGVQERSAMMFLGEEEKIKEYIQMLNSIGGKNL